MKLSRLSAAWLCCQAHAGFDLEPFALQEDVCVRFGFLQLCPRVLLSYRGF